MWSSTCNKISSTSFGKACSIHFVVRSECHPCSVRSGISTILSPAQFQILATTFARRICSFKADWHGGSSEIWMTLVWFNYFPSNRCFLASFTFFWRQPYKRHTYSFRLSMVLSSTSHEEPSRLNVIANLSSYCNTFQHKAFPFCKERRNIVISRECMKSY